MIDVYWLSDTSMAVSANPRSGRITIHETKRNLVQYHSISISALVVVYCGLLSMKFLQHSGKIYPSEYVNSSEVKGLLAVRSHDIPQCPMEHLTTHKRFNGITLEGDCLCSGEKQKRNE